MWKGFFFFEQIVRGKSFCSMKRSNGDNKGESSEYGSEVKWRWFTQQSREIEMPIG